MKSFVNARRSFVLFGGALAALGAAGLLRAREAGSQLGRPAPPFAVPDTSNRTRTLSEFAGKTLVLEWTSPVCPFAGAQYRSGVMQHVQRWAIANGVAWLTILSTHPSREEYLSPAKAEAFNRARGAEPTALLMDSEGVMGHAYGAIVTPTVFIVAPTGTVAYAGGVNEKPTMDPNEARVSRNLVRAALEDLATGRRVATPSSRPLGCTIAYQG